jgi:hypothetical protein
VNGAKRDKRDRETNNDEGREARRICRSGARIWVVANPKGELDYIHPATDHKAAEGVRLRKQKIDERLRAYATAKEPNLGPQ